MRHRIFVFILIFVSVSGCMADEQRPAPGNPFLAYVDQIESIPVSFVVEKGFEETPMHQMLNLVVDKTGRPIVVDSSNWTLHLLSVEGEPIQSVGGRGQGPGEYGLINDLYIDSQSRLYVLDKNQHRVTVYHILEDDLELEKTLSLQNYSDYRIESFYYSEHQGYMGVFYPSHRNAGEIYPIYVYRLDENLRLDELLFELPGNETMLLGNYVEDSFLGLETVWHATGESFYYATSDDFTVHRIDLRDLSKESYPVPGVPEYKFDDQAQQAIFDRIRPDPQSYPGLEDELLESETVPYFMEIRTDGNIVYFAPLPFQETGFVLRLDLGNQKMTRIEVPRWFVPYAQHEEKLYGIIHSELEGSSLLILELAE